MDNYSISVSMGKAVHDFEVGEYLHHDGESCKFKVFQDGVMVASFEPDSHEYLQICQNPGKLKEDLLHLLAYQIEAHHPYSVKNNPKKI